MTIQTTYTQARANLAALFDAVSEDREIVIVQRRGAEDVAVIAADELAAWTTVARAVMNLHEFISRD